VSIPASESWLTESLTKESHLVENRCIETGFINRPAALWRPSAELGLTRERCGRETNDTIGWEPRTMHADKRANKQSGRGARLVMTQRDMVWLNVPHRCGAPALSESHKPSSQNSAALSLSDFLGLMYPPTKRFITGR